MAIFISQNEAIMTAKILKTGPWIAAVVSLIAISACSSQNFEQPPESKAFAQKITYNNQVDVLFVIDTKDSMSAMQKGLADQIPSFLDSLDRTGLDYQVAVTTMDMSSNGEKGVFIGSPGIMNQHSPDLATHLAARLYIGDYDWKPMTRGLEAMKNGLSGLNATSGPNAGFLRPNALLALIFLSNRDDRSAPEDYTAFLDKIRPNLPYGDRSWVAAFMGVLPDDPNCKTAAWGYAEPGMAFINLVNKSGGVAESICDGDMRRALTNVKARVLEKITVFALDAPANPASVRVTMNGEEVPNDPTNGWTFEASNNTIHFHGGAIPAATDIINVSFQRTELR